VRETKSKQIGSFTYKVRQLADPAGSKLLNRLTRILTAVLGAGLKGLPENAGGIGLADLTTQAIGDAIIALSANVADDDMQFICATLGSETQFCAAEGGTWFPLTSDNAHWSGRYLQKYQWLVFALEVNYADFLGGNETISRVSAMLQSAQKSRSPNSSPTSGGPSASSPAASTM